MENRETNLTEKNTNSKYSNLFEIPEKLPNNIKKAAYFFFATIILGIINTFITKTESPSIKESWGSYLILGMLFFRHQFQRG